jgi:hypothetical protein
MEEGNVSYPIMEAAARRGVSLSNLGTQLQGIASGTYKAVLSLDQAAKKLGVDPEWMKYLSQDPRMKKRKGGWTVDRPARGINEVVVDRDGRMIGFGTDGKFIAYTVKNKSTGESKFFWGRWDAVTGTVVYNFEDMYSDDDYEFEIDIGTLF